MPGTSWLVTQQPVQGDAIGDVMADVMLMLDENFHKNYVPPPRWPGARFIPEREPVTHESIMQRFHDLHKFVENHPWPLNFLAPDFKPAVSLPEVTFEEIVMEDFLKTP